MNKKPSIIFILLLLCLLPALLSISVTVITSSRYMKTTTENEIESMLKVTGYSLLQTFDSLDKGTYRLSGDNLFKGGTNLSTSTDTVDYIKEISGVDCTIFYGDTRYLTTITDGSGNRVLLTQCTDKVKEIVLEQGNTYFARNVNIGGQNYYGYYIPIEQKDSVVGMMFTGKPSAELTAATNSYLVYILLIGLVLLVFIVAVAFVVGKMITKQIHIIRDATVMLSKGNLTLEINDKNRIRELSDVAQAAESLRTQLVNVVEMILSCAGTVDHSVSSVDDSLSNCAKAVKDLSATMDELSSGAQSMSDSVDKQSHDMNEISENITQIAESSKATREVTETVTRVSNTAKAALNDLLKANKYTTTSADNVIVSITSVSNAVNQITTAAKMIMDISGQTNLLSLNASIEAARAGEAGRGFAVVAGEIQTLAEQSNSSAKQIQSIIEEITSKTAECTKIAAQIQDAVIKEADALKSVSHSFEDVDGNIAEAAGAVNTISDIVEIVDRNKISVLDSVTSLSGISEENAASAEEANVSTDELRANIEDVAKQADELKSVIEQLNNCVAFFQI